MTSDASFFFCLRFILNSSPSRLYPRHASALNNLGTLTHSSEEAENFYRRALDINPQHNRALFNLGNLMKYVKYYDVYRIVKSCDVTQIHFKAGMLIYFFGRIFEAVVTWTTQTCRQRREKIPFKATESLLRAGPWGRREPGLDQQSNSLGANWVVGSRWSAVAVNGFTSGKMNVVLFGPSRCKNVHISFWIKNDDAWSKKNIGTGSDRLPIFTSVWNMYLLESRISTTSLFQ